MKAHLEPSTRSFGHILIAAVTWLAPLCAFAQQAPSGPTRPSPSELAALLDCEDAALGKQTQATSIRSGSYDTTHGQWLIRGDKRDEVIACLVARHGWSALSAPDGRRGARAPR